ncbi:gluconate 5-dehydrogenase [Candidatus Peribacteria bacterium RIFOXYC1_FULL_54_13]|nr:MAG: gluconate 5-dehydrogenase [Candidatus Peribacteria bacterium RIFOXYC1_FULL_54_13]
MQEAKRLAFLNDLYGLEGKTAVCIGGGGVLCGEMAMGLSMAGAHIIVADVVEEAGRARVQAIEQQGGTAQFFQVDVQVRESMVEVTRALAVQGRDCDILINAPGVNSKKPFLDVDDDEWARIIAINLTGVRNSCQVFGKFMIQHETHGSIINIGSVTSFCPLYGVSTYCVTKVGVVSLTKSLAAEWAPRHIRVNAICPGFFPAEQNRKVLSPDRVEAIMRQTPQHRFGEPPELVPTVLLLASPVAGSYITGAAYSVDGGFTAFTL